MSRGIFIAEPGKNVDQALQYRSDEQHYQVNLLKNPPHLDIQEFRGGTGWASNTTESKEETLFSIEHGLPYTPEILIYLYVKSYNGSTTDPAAGTYSEKAIIMSGSAGAVADALYAKVDSKYFKIVHGFENFLAVSYTSDADKYLIRLKYYILSNKAGVDSYITRGY